MSGALPPTNTTSIEGQLGRHCQEVNRHISTTLYQRIRVENSRHQPPNKGLDATAVLKPNTPARTGGYGSIAIIKRVNQAQEFKPLITAFLIGDSLFHDNAWPLFPNHRLYY